jgi:hypothetical protein
MSTHNHNVTQTLRKTATETSAVVPTHAAALFNRRSDLSVISLDFFRCARLDRLLLVVRCSMLDDPCSYHATCNHGAAYSLLVQSVLIVPHWHAAY